jgi:YD repeat-containing protein
MLSETDDTSAIVYTYDSAGLVTRVAESSVLTPTVVYAYAYDSSDLVTSVTVTIDGVADYVDEYAYDSAGNLVAIRRHGQDGGDAVANVDLEITYNSDGQVATIARYLGDTLTVTATYSYDSDGLLIGLVYSQGDTILTSYTFSGVAFTLTSDPCPLAPSSQSMLPTTDTSDVSDALLTGSSGVTSLLTSVTSSDGTVTYTYDATGQLLSATYTSTTSSASGASGSTSGATGSASALSDETYTYDANGNRVTANGDVYTTGTDNQLLSDGTYWYAYDADGNRTARFIDADGDDVLDSGDTDITTKERELGIVSPEFSN